MNVLYLTINRKTFGTARILCNWIELGPSLAVTPILGVVAEDDLARWAREHHVPTRITPMPRMSFKTLFASWREARATARFALQHKARIIHCNEHACYPFALSLRRLTKLPVVCHVRYRPDRAWTQWAFGGKRKPDAVLWTSYQQQQDSEPSMDGLVEKSIQHVIPLGIDIPSFTANLEPRAATRARWGVSDDAIVLGYSAVLQPRKRVTEYVDLIERLVKEGHNVVGVLAAHTRPEFEKYRLELAGYIEKKNLGKRFLDLGRVDPIQPFLNALDIFISTSEYETFGMSVCEAMAMGKPVVVYRGGSVEEIVADAGLVVDNADTGALYEKTLPLVKDAALRGEWGRRGRDRVTEHYSPRVSIEKLVGVYRGLASG
ncbi:MAG: glycosyltransferase [Phycisphaera sp.]|nr:glycosyltransferase [Phycisphaera sp.]